MAALDSIKVKKQTYWLENCINWMNKMLSGQGHIWRWIIFKENEYEEQQETNVSNERIKRL